MKITTTIKISPEDVKVPAVITQLDFTLRQTSLKILLRDHRPVVKVRKVVAKILLFLSRINICRTSLIFYVYLIISDANYFYGIFAMLRFYWSDFIKNY